MKALIDTNIIVRVITNDDPALSLRAKELVNAYSFGEIEVLDSVIAEVIYVICYNQNYLLPRIVASKAILTILEDGRFNYSTELPQALRYFGSTNLDFVDCLLLAYSKASKSNIISFDKQLKKKAT